MLFNAVIRITDINRIQKSRANLFKYVRRTFSSLRVMSSGQFHIAFLNVENKDLILILAGYFNVAESK